MTKEEIKATKTMQSIVERYGFKVSRAGFIPCPFHKEKTASMKIYKDSYYCFGCHANGDVFTFVQGMGNVTFRDAFYELGGTYEHDSFKANLTRYKSVKAGETRKRRTGNVRTERELNASLIHIYWKWIKKSQPFSDVWCDCHDALTKQLYISECLDRKEANLWMSKT